MIIAPCAPKAARHAVQNWHYSGRMPSPPCATYGVWEDDRFVGAIVFSPGAAMHLARQFGLPPRAVAELTRVALRDHEAPVSKIISQAVKLLRRDSPALDLIVSFADPNEGHHGGIYQAMNWLYLGTSEPSTVYQDRSGRIHHARVVSKTGWKRQYGVYKRVPRADDLEPVTMPGKHRYVLPLTKRVRRQLRARSKPYPRGRSVEGDTSGNRPEDAGSTPADRSKIGS